MGDIMIDPMAIYALGAGLFSGGAAWGGVTMAIKGVKSQQEEAKQARIDISNKLDAHTSADIQIQMDLVERLARIEGKLDKKL